jgi:hypothetical protein
MTRQRHRPLLWVLLATALALGCENGVEAEAAERDRFVDTYVDLRAAALVRDDATLTDSARAAVLARHEVTEQELFDFVARYGSDLPFMRDIWNEIEVRLDSARVVTGANTP